MSVLRYILCIVFSLTSVWIVSADTETLTTTTTLNSNFAQHLGNITTNDSSGEQGIFITNADGELVLSLHLQDIVSASYQQLGGFLVAYDESGQALFELPDGSYQMQLTTPNGTINFRYLNRTSGVESAQILSMESDVLLLESLDHRYQIYLLTTGELSVIMGPDAEGFRYQVTFTGIPAFDIKHEILTNTDSG